MQFSFSSFRCLSPIVCVFISTATWAAEGPPIALSIPLGEAVSFKQKVDSKVHSETHQISIQGHEDLPKGVSLVVHLPDSQFRPADEIKIAFQASYDAPSFPDLHQTVILSDLETGTIVSAIPLNLSVRGELKLYVAETPAGDIQWSSPKILNLHHHPQGLLIRFINQTMTPLDPAFRMHLQGHSTVKHSGSNEVMSLFGDEYSYWIPESQQTPIEYRLHYRENGPQIRSIVFGEQNSTPQPNGASHDH